ncbi:hypothetical protein NKH77_06215 [Streptomyces sp. M19]
MTGRARGRVLASGVRRGGAGPPAGRVRLRAAAAPPCATAAAALAWIHETLEGFPGALLAAAARTAEARWSGCGTGGSWRRRPRGRRRTRSARRRRLHLPARGMPLDGALVALRVAGRPEADVALRLRPRR